MNHFPVRMSGLDNVELWANEYEIEPQAAQQLRNIAKLPWIHGLRVMPDVHYGKGATVGSVIAMPHALSPSAVGVDLSCGMEGVQTSLTAADLPDDLSALRTAIEAAVPVGFRYHDSAVSPRSLSPVTQRGITQLWKRFNDLDRSVHHRHDRAVRQLGTLGGGNHFIEVCLDENERVWLMLHSGSRNIGKEIAERHIGVAKTLAHNVDLPDAELSVFLAGTPEMDAYYHDLSWASEYAYKNRAVMLDLVKSALASQLPNADITYGEQISCHHNYVAREEIDGQPMYVTRKGAIRAGAGDMGLIPGSMGTGSYVVRGLGNPASFQSASHGAGRKMSRGAAKRAFTVDDLAAQTAGIECRKDAAVVDEIPGAYKDINAVIDAQRDLVEVVAFLQQVLCVKG